MACKWSPPWWYLTHPSECRPWWWCGRWRHLCHRAISCQLLAKNALLVSAPHWCAADDRAPAKSGHSLCGCHVACVSPGSAPCRHCLCFKSRLRRRRAVHLRRKCQWTRARVRRFTPRNHSFVVRLKHSWWRGRRGAPHGRHGHCHHRHDGSTLDGIAQARTGCSSSTNNKNDKDKSTQ